MIGLNTYLKSIDWGELKMIIVQNLGDRGDGVKLVRRYSDKGVLLIQKETGAMYEDPIDVEDAPYTYDESDISIMSDENIPD